MIEFAFAMECPACGYFADRVTGIGHSQKPRPGDITVCVGCGCICEFDKDLQMVLIPEDKIPADCTARKARIMVRQRRGLPV